MKNRYLIVGLVILGLGFTLFKNLKHRPDINHINASQTLKEKQKKPFGDNGILDLPITEVDKSLWPVNSLKIHEITREEQQVIAKKLLERQEVIEIQLNQIEFLLDKSNL